ncbi:hypothetical protein EGM51_13990 [Verrucomicrobia bacterium S94]|nr:hypothetical protein EGM51_13990 [Verrucomicrobia bacterium S94]
MIIKGAKDFAKHCAAVRAFMNCRYFLSLLKDESNKEIRSALWGAACVNYRRPFGKNGEFGTIKTTLIPSEFKDLHSSLKNQRDDLFAHSNSRAEKDGERIHEVIFTVSDTRLKIQDQFAHPNNGDPEKLDDLTVHLIKEISSAQNTYLAEHHSDFKFEQGEYILDWDTNNLIKKEN